MGVIKKTAALLIAAVSMTAAVPSGTVFAEEQPSAAVSAFKGTPIAVDKDGSDISNYDLNDFDTVCELRRRYGDVFFLGDQCLIINLIKEPAGSSDIVVDPDPGEYSFSGSAEITTKDICSTYSTEEHYGELMGIDFAAREPGHEVSLKWHCVLIEAKSAGDIKASFKQISGGDKDTYLVVNKDHSIAYDTDHLDDLKNFASVLQLYNNFGKCMISGDNALLIERMENYDSRDDLGIATVPFSVTGDCTYEKKEEYTSVANLSTESSIISGVSFHVYDDRQVKYHTMILTAKSKGSVYVDFEYGQSDKVDLEADEDLQLRYTDRNLPVTDAPYGYQDVVDFYDYGQLQYILRSFTDFKDCVCVTYGGYALFIGEEMPAAGGEIKPRDIELAVSEKANNTGKLKIQRKGTVKPYGFEDEPTCITYLLVSGLEPGEVTVDFLKDGYAEKSFVVNVGDDHSITGDNSGKSADIAAAEPGELIKYPANDIQYKAMLAAYPYGFKINEEEKNIFFIKPEDEISYDEDIVVNCNNRYNIERKEYGFVFSPSIFGSEEDTYVVSGLHMTKENINGSIEVITTDNEFLWVERNCEYTYPVRRDYCIKRSRKDGISVRMIDNYSGRKQEDLDKIYSLMYSGSGDFSGHYEAGSIDTLLDKNYYLLARTELNKDAFFSFTDHLDSNGSGASGSKYILKYNFEPNFANRPSVSGNAEISDMFTGGSQCYFDGDSGYYVATTDIYNYYVLTPTGDGLAERSFSGKLGAEILTVNDGSFDPVARGIGDFLLEGDFNLDGSIGIADLVTANRYMLGYTKKLTDAQKISADICGDGVINGYDLTLLRETLLEKVLSVKDMIN